MPADSPAEARRKNALQFQRARAGVFFIAREYVRYLSLALMEKTPGFGNQYEGLTPSGHRARYIPTGRLRGGWNWTTTPIRSTSKGWDKERWEDGPFSELGHESVERIMRQLPSEPMGISYIENNIAYGFDIVHGAGNHSHIGIRNFPGDTAKRSVQGMALLDAMASFRRTKL